MEDSGPLPVVDHRVEGGGGHGQQGGDEAVLAQQPQTPRSSSSSVSTPSSSSSGQAESKPAPKKRKTWKRQHLGTWTHAHEEGLKSPKDMPKAEFGELVLGLQATLFTVAIAAGQRFACTAARTSGAHPRAPRAHILLHYVLKKL